MLIIDQSAITRFYWQLYYNFLGCITLMRGETCMVFNKKMFVLIIIPGILGVLLSFAMSIFQMNRDTTITAGILLKQLDNVTQIVQHTTKLTSILVMKPCKDILGNDSNLLIVFYVQIMPDDLVMQLHRF